MTRDLTYEDTGAAITIEANDVSIDFNSHRLLLTDGAATGVLAVGVRNLELLNGTIELLDGVEPTVLTSTAIALTTVVKVHIDNILTRNTYRGININSPSPAPSSEGILIENSVHKDHEYVASNPLLRASVAVRILDSINVILRNNSVSATPREIDPTISPAATGYLFVRTEGIIIENVNLTGLDISIALSTTHNVVMDKVTVESSPLSQFNFIQIVSSINTIIRNSSFTSTGVLVFDGILLASGSNFLLENVVIKANTVGTVDFPVTAAIHVGGAGLFTDVKIVDTIVSGQNVNAIVINEASNVTLDNVVVSGALENNIRLITAQQVTIKNSDVQSGTVNGILIEATSSCNTVQTSNIRDNGLGLAIAVGSINNVIRDNNFYCNVTNVSDLNLLPTNTYVHNIPVSINNTNF